MSTVEETLEADRGAEPERGLGQRVKRGVAWGLVNNTVSRVAQLLAGVVLARILVPNDYGVYATALVAMSVLLSFNELGVSLAVVRERDIARIAPTVTTIATVSSTILFVVCVVAAPTYANAMGVPEATGMIRLMAIHLLIDGIIAVPAAVLQREFRQGRRMAIDLTTSSLFIGLSIALASAGWGAWAFAWGRAASSASSAVLYCTLSPIRVRFGFDRAEAKRLLRFGLPLAASSLLVFAVLNVDTLVVGHQLGTASLGLYVLAFNLSSWPVTLLSAAVRNVSLAGFSRLQGGRREEISEAFARSSGLVMGMTLPVCAVLAALSAPLIGFVYGDQWVGAAGALRFLAILGAARVALELAYDFLTAGGRGRALFWLQAGWTAALVPALLIGAGGAGIEGVGAAHLAVVLVAVLPAYAVVLRRAGVSLTAIARATRLPLLGAIAAGLAAYGASSLVHAPLAKLGVGGAAMLAVYAPVILRLWPRAGELLASMDRQVSVA